MPQRQFDVIASLGLHPPQDFLVVISQAYDDGVGRQDVHIGFDDVVVVCAEVELQFLKFFVRSAQPIAASVMVFGRAPMRFPIEIISQSYAVFGQVRFQCFGQFFNEFALTTFGWLYFEAVRYVCNVVFTI